MKQESPEHQPAPPPRPPQPRPTTPQRPAPQHDLSLAAEIPRPRAPEPRRRSHPQGPHPPQSPRTLAGTRGAVNTIGPPQRHEHHGQRATGPGPDSAPQHARAEDHDRHKRNKPADHTLRVRGAHNHSSREHRAGRLPHRDPLRSPARDRLAVGPGAIQPSPTPPFVLQAFAAGRSQPSGSDHAACRRCPCHSTPQAATPRRLPLQRTDTRAICPWSRWCVWGGRSGEGGLLLRPPRRRGG